MYYILSEKLPYDGDDDEEIKAKITAGKISWCNAWTRRSSSAMDMVKQLLSYGEKNRCSAQQALGHNWIGTYAPRQKLDSTAPSMLKGLRGFRKLNKFKRVSLALIVSMLADKNISAGRHMFTLLDVDGDGLVTVAELRQALEMMDGNELAAQEAKDIFSDKVKHENAKLERLRRRSSFGSDCHLPPFTYTEFLAATFDRSKHTTDAVCKAAFLFFDKDGSGQLDKSELLDGHLLGQLSEAEVEQIVEDIDQNGDGELSFEEFMALMVPSQEHN